ncbi:MAG: hypothetical protein ACK5QT_09345 [Oligoflexia bacterium]
MRALLAGVLITLSVGSVGCGNGSTTGGTPGPRPLPSPSPTPFLSLLGTYSCPLKRDPLAAGSVIPAEEPEAERDIQEYFVTLRTDELVYELAYQAWLGRFNFNDASSDWVRVLNEQAMPRAREEYAALKERFNEMGVSAFALRTAMIELLNEKDANGNRTAPRDVRSQFLKAAVFCGLW